MVWIYSLEKVTEKSHMQQNRKFNSPILKDKEFIIEIFAKREILDTDGFAAEFHQTFKKK